MKHGKITLSDETGKIFSESKISFWNARNDPTGPCVCVCLEGTDLEKFLNVNRPKGTLLQIELPFPDIIEVANE